MSFGWVNQGNAAYPAALHYLTSSIYGQPCNMTEGPILAVVKDMKPQAAILFHNHDLDADVVEMTMAATGKGWITRDLMREVAGYVFGQLECQAVIARFDEGRKDIRRMLEACGADVCIIPRLGGRNTSRAIAIISDDAWRKSRFAKE